MNWDFTIFKEQQKIVVEPSETGKYSNKTEIILIAKSIALKNNYILSILNEETEDEIYDYSSSIKIEKLIKFLLLDVNNSRSSRIVSKINMLNMREEFRKSGSDKKLRYKYFRSKKIYKKWKYKHNKLKRIYKKLHRIGNES